MMLRFVHPDAVSVERRNVQDSDTGLVQDALVIGTTLPSNPLLPGYDASRLEALTHDAVEHWKSTGTAYDTIIFTDLHVPTGGLDYGIGLDGDPSQVWLEFYEGRLSITYSNRTAAQAVAAECDKAHVTTRPEREVGFVRTDWIGAGHRLVAARKKDGVPPRKAVRFRTDDARELEVSSRFYDHDAIMLWVRKYLGYDGPPLPREDPFSA